MTLTEQFEREYQNFHSISAKRAREQRAILATFEATLGGRTLIEATASDFQAFLGGLVVSGLHVNTVRKKANMIRPFFGWAYATGKIDGDTYFRLKSVPDPRGATGRSTPKPYTRAELEAFWIALDNRLPLLPERGRGSRLLKRWLVGKTRWHLVARHAMRLQIEAIVAMALHCGLRRAEIYQLKPDDLHYDNEYVVVTGKGNKERAVPFTEPAREAARRWLDFRLLMRPEGSAASTAWLSCYGRKFNESMSFDRFEELLLKKVGAGWELHRFRHTFATERLRAGTPLEVVSLALGHSNLEQTRCYAEIVRGDIARELGKTEAAFVERVTNRAA